MSYEQVAEQRIVGRGWGGVIEPRLQSSKPALYREGCGGGRFSPTLCRRLCFGVLLLLKDYPEVGGYLTKCRRHIWSNSTLNWRLPSWPQIANPVGLAISQSPCSLAKLQCFIGDRSPWCWTVMFSPSILVDLPFKKHWNQNRWPYPIIHIF